jgi:pimeloyl-ACP methyl ester carboxylesterase
VSDGDILVEEVRVPAWGEGSASQYWSFEPTLLSATTGFIIYPGGSIDPRSYAPTARNIALEGFRIFIVSMPLEIALMGSTRAERVRENHPEVDRWAIGGHSLGGVAACAYAKENTSSLDGVVLWASYPSAMYRLDGTNLQVSSIYGALDGLTTLSDIEQSRDHLPMDTQWVEIDGGNHTQFGWYGDGTEIQRGDNPATISREAQQAIIVDRTASCLAGL